MKTYYLVQNLMYNAKHIVQRRWWHRVFGEPSLTVASVEAVSRGAAEAKFKLMRQKPGLGF